MVHRSEWAILSWLFLTSPIQWPMPHHSSRAHELTSPNMQTHTALTAHAGDKTPLDDTTVYPLAVYLEWRWLSGKRQHFPAFPWWISADILPPYISISLSMQRRHLSSGAEWREEGRCWLCVPGAGRHSRVFSSRVCFESTTAGRKRPWKVPQTTGRWSQSDSKYPPATCAAPNRCMDTHQL